MKYVHNHHLVVFLPYHHEIDDENDFVIMINYFSMLFVEQLYHILNNVQIHLVLILLDVVADDDMFHKMFQLIIQQVNVLDYLFYKVQHDIQVQSIVVNEQSIQIYDDVMVQQHNRIYFQQHLTKHFYTFHSLFLHIYINQMDGLKQHNDYKVNLFLNVSIWYVRIP